MTRTSSDILLELESKIDLLTDLVRAQDLNIKILSNKLKYAIDSIGSQPKIDNAKKPFVEIAETKPLVKEIKATPLPEQELTVGVRRTSRAESYTGKTLNPFDQQAPPAVDTTAIVSSTGNTGVPVIVKDEIKQVNLEQNNPLKSALVQKVVDRHGKAVFLAEVEIINSLNGEILSKIKTNSAGNWTATIPSGKYKILIRKRESLTKESIEMTQNVVIDGSSYNLKLPTVTLK